MLMIDIKKLTAYRQGTFHLLPEGRVSTPEQAFNFINERGFVFFWPIEGVDYPSLWKAVAGDRKVPNEHDDPGHKTWRWKDEALGKRLWYYGKVLRRKATIISLDVVPNFYALSDNYGSPDEDYLVAYEAGRLTQAARQIFEALLEKGPLDTISLRKEARLQNAKDSLFARGLDDLQADFKILPVGIAEAGAWRYAYRYDITTRHFPDLQEQARMINESDARQMLAGLYFRSMGAARIRDVCKLFRWTSELASRAVQRLVDNHLIIGNISHPKDGGEWFADRMLFP